MKIINYILIIGMIFSFACGEMNDIHQEYLDQGEQTYLGRVDSVVVMPGNGRLIVDVLYTFDPRVKKGQITWNNEQNVFEFDVVKDENLHQQIEVTNIEEGVHLFKISVLDGKGNFSIPAEKSIEIYGEKYAERALRNKPRKIRSFELVAPDRVIIGLENVGNENVMSSVIKYISYADNPDGEEAEFEITNEDQIIELTNIQFGDEIFMHDILRPVPEALDTYVSGKKRYNIPAQIFPKPGNEWIYLDGSSANYEWVNVYKDLAGTTTFVEGTDNIRKYEVPMAAENTNNWRLGITINEDSSIDLYVARINGSWVMNLDYEAEDNYFDALNGIIHLKYNCHVVGAWGGWCYNTAILQHK